MPIQIAPYQPPPDATTQLSRLAGLAGIKQEQQLRDQQIQAASQENQQRAIAIKDQQAMTSAMQQWDGKSYDDLVPLVVKNGGSANAVIGLKQKGVELKAKYSQIAKDDAETGKNNIETLLKKNDVISGKLANIMNLPDDQIGQGLTGAASELAQGGLIDPQHAQMAAQLAQLPPPQMRQQLDTFRKSFMADSQQLSEAKDKADIELKNQQAAAEKARIPQVQAEAQMKAEEANYHQVLSNMAQNIPVAPPDMKRAQAYEASQRKTSTQSDSLGISSSSTSGPSGLAQYGKGSGGAGGGLASAASAKDTLVDQIGQYKVNPSMLSRMIVKHPDIIAAVSQKYPDWDQTNYEPKAKMMISYTSGSHSGEINAINTAMGHVKELDDAVAALNNGDVQFLNKLGNKLSVALGKDPVTTFKAIVHKVGPEIAGAYIPGGGGQGERVANEEDFSPDMSSQQLHNNAAKTVTLLRSKVGSLENQYKQTVGRDDFQQRFITPDAQAAFQRFAPVAVKPQAGPQGSALPNDPFAAFGGAQRKP